MSRLFIGDPGSTWRDHLKSLKAPYPLLVLDPSDVEFGPPARVKVWYEGKLLWERFYGSLDPQRAPHVLLAALAHAKLRWGDEMDVLCFNYRPSPVLRQTISLIAQLQAPQEIWVSAKAKIDLGGFPVGPETVELPPAFPNLVRQAQHRGHWVKMLEKCVPHAVSFRDVALENCRLGVGTPLTADGMKKAGLEGAQYAEVAGETLFIVSSGTLTEQMIARAVTVTETRTAVTTDPAKYAHLLCSFADQEGNDFGFGKIESIDWTYGRAQILCDAPPPAPIRLLRLGWLRVDDLGVEIGEVKSWQV